MSIYSSKTVSVGLTQNMWLSDAKRNEISSCVEEQFFVAFVLIMKLVDNKKNIEYRKKYPLTIELIPRVVLALRNVCINSSFNATLFPPNNSSWVLSQSAVVAQLAWNKKWWLPLNCMSLKAYCAPIQTVSVDPVQVHRMTSAIPSQIKLIDIRARTKSKRTEELDDDRSGGEDSVLNVSKIPESDTKI